MNFQDLLERYDLPAVEQSLQSSARPRVRGGPHEGWGATLRTKYRCRRVRVERKHAAFSAAPVSAKDNRR